ncbi:tetratricopeptide repeat protein [Candidatus Poribacteria bacterium]|nr:tetratricopeptide repeat protein [Candidatus Poribacteria bacterium]
MIKAALFYEDQVKSTRNIWDYLDARELYFDAGEYNKAGGIVVNISQYLHRWGYIELVKRLNEQTIDTATGLIKAGALHNFGNIYETQGEYAKAIEKYNQSLKINEELGDKRTIASTLGQLGKIYKINGDFKNALKNYIIALLLFEQLKSPYMELARKNIDNIKTNIGENKFNEYYNEIIKVYLITQIIIYQKQY